MFREQMVLPHVACRLRAAPYGTTIRGSRRHLRPAREARRARASSPRPPPTMRLTAFRVAADAMPIRPAAATREWMEQTGERFAYRCLPLVIANTHGWEILCPASIEVYWRGGTGLDDLKVVPLDDHAGPAPAFATSHFGSGVLTLHTGYLFRTDPGYNLYVTGPVNRPKDGAVPLTGIVETDWLPQPFTMNWLFTAPGGPLVFEKGEPMCHIFPVPRDLVEQVEPEIRDLASEPELHARYQQWAASRAQFNRDLRVPGSEAQAEKWQRHYLRGRHPDGTPGTEDHRTRLKVREFRKGD